MRAMILSAALATAAGASVAAAQTVLVVPQHRQPPRGYDTLHESKAALAGQETRLWWAQMLDPDCSAHGAMTTAVVDPPRHGAVRLSDEPFFPNYPPENPRAACDAHKAPGKQAFYIAETGYKGSDRVVLQNSTSEGRIRKIVVDIDVR